MPSHSYIELFILMMVGHFVGDYLLQTQAMAVGKSVPGKEGHIWCSIHVMWYTLAVCLFAGISNPLVWLAIAVPHWIIDRWSLAKSFLAWKNGYTMKQTWKDAPLCATPVPDELQQNVWKVAFAAPVYILNDNTMHFVCLLITARCIM